MGAADRTVQHLHLSATSAQAAVHAVHRLEDALRCASLPDTGERLLLVRRLHLGRLPAGLSSQSLSLLIEQRVLAAGGSWVHGEHGSDNLFDAIYLSATTYTTLGIGDLAPVGAVRLVSGMEALTGFLMITWSASFTYLEMSRLWTDDRRA